MTASSESRLIDISPLLSTKTAVWPGDTPLKRRVLCDISQGSNIDLSTLESTVHIGAHADAPKHFHASGVTIDEVNLDAYIGPCIVKTVLDKRTITAQDCLSVIESGLKRVLFRTLSAPNSENFNTDFTSFSADAVARLGEAGVLLIGIDTPSFDNFDSKDLASHQMLYRYKIANVEGLVLTHVQDGIYEFIGLPLRLAGFDASPIRAVLRTRQTPKVSAAE